MADNPQTAPAPEAEERNPFAERLAADPSLGQVSLVERARLNATEAAFRGTIAGSIDLAEFERALPEQAERIRTDLARYEAMRSFEGPLEGAVALSGQLFGGMQSPEAFLAPGAKMVAGLTERLIGGVASRILGAGTGQAAVQAVANPAIQASEMRSGLRKAYSPGETAAAMAGGFVLGGALHGAGEVAGALARRTRPEAAPKPKDAEVDAAIQARAAEARQTEAANMAALANEDPSLRSGSEPTPRFDLEGSRQEIRSDANVSNDLTPDSISKEIASSSPTEGGGFAASEAPAMDAPAVVADPPLAAARAVADVPERPEPAEPEAARAAPQDDAPIIIPPAARRPSGKPLSLTQFIARNGGIALDGDARANDFHRMFIPGGGPLARERGRSVDGFWRESLIEHGYLPEDPGGGTRRDIRGELYDAIARERRGERVYSAQDRPPERRQKVDTQTREIEAEARRIRKAMKDVGLRDGDVDVGALTDAAELLWRGDADDPLVALEHAIMAREASSTVSRGGEQMVEGLQFSKRPKATGESALARLSAALDEEAALRPKRDALAGLLRHEAPADPLSDLAAALKRVTGKATENAPKDDALAALERGLAEYAAAKPEAADPLAALERALADVRPERPEASSATARVEMPVAQREKAAFSPSPVRRRLEQAYLKLTSGQTAQRVNLDALRRELADLDRSAVDKALLDIAGGDKAAGGGARLSQDSDPKRIPQSLKDAAFDPAGGSPFHILWLNHTLEQSERGTGSGIQFRKREAAPSEPGRPGPPDSTANAAAGAGPSASEPLRSLQQQAQALADALDVPLRQGRVRGGKDTLGQYDVGQDVARVRNVADFETVAHEAGHALEKRVAGLPDLIQRFGRELGPLDYEPQRADPREGFAEWMRGSMLNPATGPRQAPGFSAAFRDLMSREAPDLLAGIDTAASAHQAYLTAPSGEKLAAMVRKPEDEGVVRSIRRDGLPATIGLYLSRGYEAVFDDKAPVARAVRDMARAIHAATGERVKLEGSDNPENLVRLFPRAQQAAVQDMRQGVRPYRGIAPEGPSLADALATATGAPGRLGRWNAEAVSAFDQYLVARRAEVLYRRFEAGELERRPIALSPDEVRAAIAEVEAANPGFRAGADQIHGFTRQLLRKQYEGGLIDADLFGRLMEEEFYVPLYRHMDERPEGLRGGTGGADGPGTVDTVKRLRGSDRDVIPPSQSLMTQAFLVNRTLQHNDIIKSFVALARQGREAGATGIGRILEEIPPTQMIGKRFDLGEAVLAAARAAGTDRDDLAVLTGALTDVFGDDPIMTTIFRAEPAGKRGEPIVFYKDGGQMRAVRLQARDEGLALYETIAGLPPMARDFALQFGATTSTLLRQGIVTNPTFALTNFVRDQLAVGILRSDYVPFVGGARGVVSELRQDQWAGLYAYAGGVSPGAGSAGLSDLIDRDVNALARKGWAAQKVGSLADLSRGHVLGPLKAVAETVETAEAGTRLSVMRSVFQQKKRQGLSDYDAMIEAAAQATDVLDFGRHGAGTLYVRTLVPFLNAHLQGLDKARRTLIEPLWRAARGETVTEFDAAAVRNAGLGLTKMVGIGGALGTMYGLWAAGHEAYQDANEELRATHLIIPGDAFGRPGKILVVPKPFELAMGFNLGEAVGLRIATGDPRAASFAIDGVREVIQPPNPLTGIPLVKTAAELALNRSFFTGRDIVPENLQNKENPRFETKPNTSGLAKAIGNALNISPIKVDYAVGSMFGNWGRDLLAVSGQGDSGAPAAAQEDTMFLRRFIKGADRTSETTKLFWEQAAQRNGAFAQAAAHYGDLLKGFQDGEAADYLAALPASQRAYVMLSQGGADDGKAAFTADDRRLHPITRAGAAVSTISGLIRELTNNSQKTFGDGTRIGMDPRQRRDVIDALRALQAIEQRNALVLTGQRGYEGRVLLSAEDQFAVIRAQSPITAAELATRYATNKILKTEMVAQLWPDAQKALLADGTQADIRDLSLTARGEGWAFDGDAVKKPQRRRVTITPGENPRAREPSGFTGGPSSRPVPNPFQ